MKPNLAGDFPGALGEGGVAQTFGWLPGVGGAAAVLFGVQQWLDGARWIAVGLVLAGGVLVLFERRRRRDRAVLVRMADRVGIYRRGVLASVIAGPRITHLELSLMNTLYLSVIGPAGGVGFAMAAFHGAPVSIPAGGAILAFAASASVIFTRMGCEHFYIPLDRPRFGVIRRAKILLRNREAELLLGPPGRHGQG